MLDLLVLKALQAGPLHGYAISLRLGQLSKDALSIEEGSLYPALYRMEERPARDRIRRALSRYRVAAPTVAPTRAPAPAPTPPSIHPPNAAS
jgi:Transcriptional regulator PadR-like family